ncbi:MAG TPA: BglII/BstYI family type II restriction endonuclease [Anaerolineae bacterium]|nr:hypothetical protein [Gammaproteobacteria bacterium]HRX05092.1 BglII/BstYI family type II restriction endonuclease [Anaerolineae bacterium]
MNNPHLPDDLQELYEVYDYRHAATILRHDFPDEYADICDMLRRFRFTGAWVTNRGGSESEIPKAFKRLLLPMGWEREKVLRAKLVLENGEDEVIQLDTHKIDYVKNRVAFDVEWNSKDQTFDRDLYAMRAFFDYGRISLGVLVTRGNDLNSYFASLGTFMDGNRERRFKDKYGATTTHMGKLIPRLENGRSGGCPILAFGITQKLLDSGTSQEQEK